MDHCWVVVCVLGDGDPPDTGGWTMARWGGGRPMGGNGRPPAIRWCGWKYCCSAGWGYKWWGWRENCAILSFSISASCTRFAFALRFWNQIFTCWQVKILLLDYFVNCSFNYVVRCHLSKIYMKIFVNIYKRHHLAVFHKNVDTL